MLAPMSLRSRLALSVIVALATVAVLMLWRSFVWQLALLVGIGAAVLVYSTTGTVERLRDLYRER
jgi:xanthine/uracil permease